MTFQTTRRSMLRQCFVFSALALSSGALMGVDACDSTPDTGIKIMPLGDSITDGFNVPGGYRINLENLLVDTGRDIDFVGSGSNGPPDLEDQDHEGHSGWRIDELSANIGEWLETSQPEIVLLLIGTNDVLQDYALSTAPDRLGALMDQIVAWNPATKVVVASIPPVGDSANNAQAITFNATIPGLVDARVAQGAMVSYVDMYAVLTPADLADGIHPTAAGYDKMAVVWAQAVLELTGP